jgi:hypothetical protein
VYRRNKKFETFSDLFKQKKPPVVASPAGFSILGSLSAPRFRSVLSHKIYHCALEGLYAKKGRPGILSFAKMSSDSKMPRLGLM